MEFDRIVDGEAQSEEFIEVLLNLMQECANGNTDNCDLSFDVGDWKIKCNITFENPIRISEE